MAKQVIIPASSSHAKHALIQDVVFDLWKNGKRSHWFSVSYVSSATGVMCEELADFDEMGMEGGTGIYQITGDLIIPQNSYTTLNNLTRHAGERFNMHVLFRSGLVKSFIFRSKNGLKRNYKTDEGYGHIYERYPLAGNYQDKFGVRIRIAEAFGGSPFETKIILSGITLENTSYYVNNPTEFYAKFPIIATSGGSTDN